MIFLSTSQIIIKRKDLESQDGRELLPLFYRSPLWYLGSIPSTLRCKEEKFVATTASKKDTKLTGVSSQNLSINQMLICVGTAKQSIEMQKVTYTSALRYNETSKTYYRDFDPNLPQYVGKPSPEIDKARHDLLEGKEKRERSKQSNSKQDNIWHSAKMKRFN